MLVLTRKAGEEIVLGSDVVVKVISVLGDKVKIGVEAPRALRVLRREVWVRLHQPDAECVPSGPASQVA